MTIIKRLIKAIIMTRKDIFIPLICAHFNIFVIIFIIIANNTSNNIHNFLFVINTISGLYLLRMIYTIIKSEFKLQKVEDIVVRD